MTPLTTSLKKFTHTANYLNSVLNFSSSAFCVMSPKTQCSVSTAYFYKQIDGCGMGNPLSPVLANIFMAKLESDVVRPYNPLFYERYVDDCFSKRKKGKPDDLLDHLNSYHPNIVFTVKENPDHFLDTASLTMINSTAESTRNQENYQATGNQKSHQMEKKLYYWCPPQS